MDILSVHAQTNSAMTTMMTLRVILLTITTIPLECSLLCLKKGLRKDAEKKTEKRELVVTASERKVHIVRIVKRMVAT